MVATKTTQEAVVINLEGTVLAISEVVEPAHPEEGEETDDAEEGGEDLGNGEIRHVYPQKATDDGR